MQIIDENKNTGESKTENKNTESFQNNNQGMSSDMGKMLIGFIVAGIGILFLAREIGFNMPGWIFSWKTLLIGIGLYIGVKSSFENTSWLILVLIGSAFLLRDLMPDYNLFKYFWPVGLIIVGLYIIVKPRNTNSKKWSAFQNKQTAENTYGQSSFSSASASQQSYTNDEYIETSAVFGSVKKTVISKNFKGGEINCVFGGGEINMTQADFNGIVRLELNAVFGGIRLIVPAHWEIKSELTAVLGSVEDKRFVNRNVTSDTTKFLVLEGNAVFGGIEILSY